MTRPILVVGVIMVTVAWYDLAGRCYAATLTNYLNSVDWPQVSMNVNAGDTVTWVNQESFLPNRIQSYDGKWQSPLLALGQSFSVTFTNAGFYAYSTALGPGTVLVSAWTNSPAVARVAVPTDGFVFPHGWPWLMLQADVARAADVTNVEFVVNGNVVGSVTQPPYELIWTNTGDGVFSILVQTADGEGMITRSPIVTVTVGVDDYVWGERFLPSGQFLLYYSASMYPRDSLYQSSRLGWIAWWSYAGLCQALGVFIDETPAGAMPARRFYEILPGG